MSLLIADSRRMRVAELDDPDDEQPEWLGSPGAGVGEFDTPIGVAARPGGGFVIADSGNHRLVGIAAIDGSGWETLGSQGSGEGCFERPSGVAVDAGGRIYVADTGNGRIVGIDDLSGAGWEEYGTPGAPSASDPAAVGRFGRPFGLAVDGAGRVAVADPGAGRIVRIDSLGGAGWSASAGAPGPRSPVAVDSSASLVVADVEAGALELLADPPSAPSATTSAGALYAPVAVATDTAEAYVLDAGAAAGRLVRLDAQLNVLDARPLEELGFRAPVGICVA